MSTNYSIVSEGWDLNPQKIKDNKIILLKTGGYKTQNRLWVKIETVKNLEKD